MPFTVLKGPMEYSFTLLNIFKYLTLFFMIQNVVVTVNFNLEFEAPKLVKVKAHWRFINGKKVKVSSHYRCVWVRK